MFIPEAHRSADVVGIDGFALGPTGGAPPKGRDRFLRAKGAETDAGAHGPLAPERVAHVAG